MFVSRLSANEKKHVDLTKHHVPFKHIFMSLQEFCAKNGTRITQIYKHKSRLQKEIKSIITEI